MQTKAIEEQLIEAIDEALREHPLGVLRFLELEAERRHWTCSYRQRRSEYGHWVDPDHPRSFDVRSLPNVIRIVGHARFVDLLLGLEQRVQRERRADGLRSSERQQARIAARAGAER